MTNPSELRGLLSGFSLVAIVVLLAISVDVGLPGQELLSTLRFHIGAVLLLLPVLLAMARARWRALAMLGIVLASLGQGAGLVATQQQRRVPLEAGQPLASLEVLSFNVLNENRHGADAAAYIAGSDADVVVLMEGLGVRGGLGLDGGEGDVAARYPYRFGCEERQACDTAILSRTPLTETERHKLPGFYRNRLLVARTAIDGQPLTIVALHLTKPYYDNFSDMELQAARAVIAGLEGPVVLAGDFNAAAWSNDISAFADDLGLIPPPAHPSTWPVELGWLGVPIDNMFTHGPALVRTIAPTPGAFGSNHLGLVGTVDLF